MLTQRPSAPCRRGLGCGASTVDLGWWWSGGWLGCRVTALALGLGDGWRYRRRALSRARRCAGARAVGVGRAWLVRAVLQVLLVGGG